MGVCLVTREAELARAAEELSANARVALDLEADGMFAYRAKVCVVQLCAGDDVTVVDPLAVPLGGLAALLASESTAKIIHDVAFDARVLAEAGLALANVRDTALAARMLGRTSTGLASLLSSELGVSIDKAMQHHDWSKRPLDEAALSYLTTDVVHLAALADELWDEVDRLGIGPEIDEETRYRVAQAAASAARGDPRPAFARLKGIDRAPPADLPILKRLAEVRERQAEALDVPPYKVMAPDVMFAIARAKPRSMSDLSRVRGAAQGRARAIAKDVLRAVREGLEAGALTDEERALLARPRPPPGEARARKAREQRLTAWRKAEAKRRGHDEQVVLPGHCLQELAALAEPSIDAIARVGGIGAFRVARDGEALVRALEEAEAR